jgi:hypothetical protein
MPALTSPRAPRQHSIDSTFRRAGGRVGWVPGQAGAPLAADYVRAASATAAAGLAERGPAVACKEPCLLQEADGALAPPSRCSLLDRLEISRCAPDSRQIPDRFPTDSRPIPCLTARLLPHRCSLVSALCARATLVSLPLHSFGAVARSPRRHLTGWLPLSAVAVWRRGSTCCAAHETRTDAHAKQRSCTDGLRIVCCGLC